MPRLKAGHVLAWCCAADVLLVENKEGWHREATSLWFYKICVKCVTSTASNAHSAALVGPRCLR